MGRVLFFPMTAKGRRHSPAEPNEPPRTRRGKTAPHPAWVRDLRHARALQQSPAGAAAFQLLTTHEPDVARRIAVLEPYCHTLWRAVPTLAHPELLECLFWGDQLTVALVAARAWRAAHVWCTRIARLPRRARLDAAPGLRRAVARRAVRCRRMLRMPVHAARPHAEPGGR